MNARGACAIVGKAAIIAAACLFSVAALPLAGQRKPAERPQVDLVVEKRGTVRIELLPDAAPKTVGHFLALVDRKFYDGVLFHRLDPEFVLQAGDPNSRKVDGQKIANLTSSEVAQLFQLGLGGSGKTVPLEASVPCTRGTVALAHSVSPDSGDSQFFFNLSENHRLDNQYTVFGRIVRGLDVVDLIRQGDRIRSLRRVPVPKSERPVRPRRGAKHAAR